MALVTCPKCGGMTERGALALWPILVSIFLFPLGLLALFYARRATTCAACGNVFQG